jgi:hypothetical protein
MGFELWKASTTLPAEVINALPRTDKPHDVAV